MNILRYHPDRIAEAFPSRDDPPAQIPGNESVVQTGPPQGDMVSPALPAPDAESLLKQIAPGNWHTPMLRAVARFVACGWPDEKILAATESFTLSGWTRDKTRREVQAMIDGARRKGFGRRTPSWGLVQGVPPGYESDPLPSAQATAELKDRISHWFDRASALSHARRELAQRYRSSFARRMPRKMAEEIRQEIKEKYGVKNLRAAPRLAIQAAAGLGKTAAVVSEIMSRRELWDLHIWIFVPTLDLAERLAEQFTNLSFEPRFAPGPEVRVMRGRLARATEERGPREPKTMCRKPDASDLASRLGINVFKTLCKSGAGICDHYDRCPWISQWDDREPAVRIWAHEYLHLPKLSGFPGPNLVIADESTVEVLAGELDFAPDRLTEKPTWAEGDNADLIADCLRSIHEAVSGDKPALEAFRSVGLDKEVLSKAAEAAEGREDGDTGVTPGMAEADAVERLASLEESERKKIAKLLRQASKEISLPRPQSHAIQLRRNVPVELNGRIERQNRVCVWWRRKVLLGRTTPLLLIDADADAEISRRLYGEPLEHVAIPVERNAVVTQCHTSNFSRQSLLGFPGAAPDFLAKAARRLETVKNLVRKLAQAGRLFIVCPLPVRRAITRESEPRLPLCCTWEGATISHFGRIRGVDDWRHYDAVMMIGREQPPPLAVEGLARAIWDDEPEPLNLPGTYSKALRGYRLKSGDQIGTEVDTHPDSRVRKVLELKRERESLQAIDRIRLIHTDKIKEVYILTRLPLDLDVDKLVSLQELLNGQGSRLEKAYRRNCGGLPLVSICLAERWPDLFPNARAAEYEISKKNQCDPRTLKGEIDSISLFGVLRFRPADSRTQGGAQRWSRAMLAADTPYFRSRVRDAMGCDLVWELPPTGKVFDNTFGSLKA